METIFISTKNSKTDEQQKLVLNLSQRSDLRSSNEHVTQNFSIYYTWKNIRKHYKNNKFKIITATWNGKFELPDGSY